MSRDTKKGGRPKKNTLEKQQKVVSTKLNSPQYYAVRGRAKAANLSISEYLRQAAINGVILPRITPEEVNLYKQLAGEARNLNQLAKLAHKEGLTSILKILVNLIQNLLTITNKITDDWKNNKRKLV